METDYDKAFRFFNEYRMEIKQFHNIDILMFEYVDTMGIGREFLVSWYKEDKGMTNIGVIEDKKGFRITLTLIEDGYIKQVKEFKSFKEFELEV